MIRAVIALLAILLLPTGAEAYCAQWGVRHAQQQDWPFSVFRQRYCRHWVGDETRVYGYERRDDEERWERRDPSNERGVSCKTEIGPIRVVGGKHLTQPGAIKDAVGRWESSIGYDYGEKFANMENARGYRWRCDKASTNETAFGRAAEGAANVLTGGNADAYYKRCVVIATPCMQPVVRGDEDKR